MQLGGLKVISGNSWPRKQMIFQRAWDYNKGKDNVNKEGECTRELVYKCYRGRNCMRDNDHIYLIILTS